VPFIRFRFSAIGFAFSAFVLLVSVGSFTKAEAQVITPAVLASKVLPDTLFLVSGEAIQIRSYRIENKDAPTTDKPAMLYYRWFSVDTVTERGVLLSECAAVRRERTVISQTGAKVVGGEAFSSQFAILALPSRERMAAGTQSGQIWAKEHSMTKGVIGGALLMPSLFNGLAFEGGSSTTASVVITLVGIPLSIGLIASMPRSKKIYTKMLPAYQKDPVFSNAFVRAARQRGGASVTYGLIGGLVGIVLIGAI